jgi:predicted amidohydrolase
VLVIAVAQPMCVPKNVTLNAMLHAMTVREARARVVVFPEMSLTGYEFDVPALGVDDPRLRPLVEACAETGSLALVGAPVIGDHIAVLAVDGSGVTVAYRKMYLGAAETARFSPGTEPAVLDVDGRRIGLAICKDTGVPRHATDTAALGIDGYVAGVLERIDEAAVIPQRAGRVATEHGVWVAVASFAGSTGGGYDQAAGRSGFWAAGGALIAQAGPERGTIVRETLP